MSQNPAPSRNIFALLIGVDKYSYIPTLSGCLNDVKEMRSFLDECGAKPEHIRVLTDLEATRQNILSAFDEHLIHNDAIQVGDPILFFFAGHGNRVNAPTDWGGDGKTEFICPVDQRHYWYDKRLPYPDTEARLHAKGEPGIPARTLNALFRRLAHAKGDNITAIIDACCSGNVLRGGETGNTIRTYEKPIPIEDPELDKNIWGSLRGGDKVSDDFMQHVSEMPHVLLAACKPTEFAAETTKDGKDRGAFTVALLGTLHKNPLATCLQTIESIQISATQHPQCGGANKERRMFDLADSRSAFTLTERIDGQGNKSYEVKAGQIHGVVLGTEFSIYVDSSRCLGTLSCAQSSAQSSVLAHLPSKDFNVPSGAYAVVSSWKTDLSVMKVHFTDSSVVDAVAESLSKAQTAHFRSVTPEEEPNVKVHLESGNLIIEHLDPLLRDFEPKRSLSVPLENIVEVLNHISAFRYHLLRRHGDQESEHNAKRFDSFVPDLEEPTLVQTSLLRLTELSALGYRKFVDKKQNLFATHHAVIDSSEKDRYGVEIENHIPRGLYPYVFYFDLSDYSVKAWYVPFSPNMEPPLSRDSKISIGLGAGGGGGDPLRFLVAKPGTAEKGFLKVFLSSAYVDMNHIVQMSVEKAFPRPVNAPLDSDKRGEAGPVRDPVQDIWATSLEAVTIR